MFKSKVNLLPVVQPTGVGLVVGKGKVEISPSGDLRLLFKSKQGQNTIMLLNENLKLPRGFKLLS